MIEQRTPEWFAARAGKFTGSRFADLMAKTRTGPSASRGRLITRIAIERITGTCVETYSNAAMRRGTELEPDARDAYEIHVGEMVEECAWLNHPALPHVGVSPDGLVGKSGMVEIKCPDSEEKHWEAITRGAHAHEYHWQLQGQLWVSGRQWVDAVSFDPRFPESLRLMVTRVMRCEDAIGDLAEAVAVAEVEVQERVEEMRAKMGERERAAA